MSPTEYINRLIEQDKTGTLANDIRILKSIGWTDEKLANAQYEIQHLVGLFA